MDKELLAVAGGSKPADVVISNGRIVNVYTGEIYDGGVAISGQTIAAVGDVDYCVGEGTKTIDAEGAFITPGFIDGHIPSRKLRLGNSAFRGSGAQTWHDIDHDRPPRGGRRKRP